jgi:hypothetical protein
MNATTARILQIAITKIRRAILGNIPDSMKSTRGPWGFSGVGEGVTDGGMGVSVGFGVLDGKIMITKVGRGRSVAVGVSVLVGVRVNVTERVGVALSVGVFVGGVPDGVGLIVPVAEGVLVGDCVDVGVG